MNQLSHPTRNGADAHPFSVQAPNDYDGIGQALRSAYRDHREPPGPIATALHALKRID